MAYRYFRGRIDIGRLPLTELSAAAEALATLERLASDGLIGFEMGVARIRKEPKQTARRMQPQEREMLEAMPPGEWMSARDIGAVLPAMTANSLAPRLSSMAENGWVETSRRVVDRPAGTRGRRTVKIYRRPVAIDEDPDAAPRSARPPFPDVDMAPEDGTVASPVRADLEEPGPTATEEG